MKRINKFVAVFLSVIIIIGMVPINAHADSSVRMMYSVIVNGNEVGSVPVLDLNYDNNIYVSIKGIAKYLSNTEKAFSVSVSEEEILISRGKSFEGTMASFSEDELNERTSWKLKRTPVYIDDVEKRYYSIVGNVGEEGIKDAFFSPLRIAMALDINVSVEKGVIAIDTLTPFGISDVELDNSGYLQGINSLLIGDGTTGEIYYGYEFGRVVPIASTTKLMTYFVLMDAVSKGEVSLDDNVNISSNAVKLSEGIDGLVSFDGISSMPLTELVYAMLLPSCNECALAIAEHVSGSEEAFVERMNNKAKEVGAAHAEFYNCNGLPVYDNQLLPAKMQNHMTAEDMFIIVSELVKTYPQVMDITSVKVISLPTLHYEAKNTNALLYNMDEVKGLKTGTTNKSGACLVVVMPMEKDGEIHNLFTVLFGAEGELDRAMVAELASKICIAKFEGNEVISEEKYTITPDDPNLDVERMLRKLK